MTGSALVGQPPATEEDFFIIRGALRVAHQPDSDDVVKKGISSVKVPPGAAHDSRQGTIIAQMAVTIALISLITITRLLLRAFKRELKWGLDDWAIILGLTGVVAWLTLTILAVSKDPLSAWSSIYLSHRQRKEVPESTFTILHTHSITDISAAVHIALEWTLLAVPLIVLYKLEKMSLSKKIRIGMLFSIGLVACIGSAMRQYMQNHSYKDRVYHYPEQLKWTIVDIFFGTIAASMPVLNALIPKKWRKADGHILPDSLTIFRSSRGSKGKGAVSLDSESTGVNSQHSVLSQQATKDSKLFVNVANEIQFQMEDVDGEVDNTRTELVSDGSDRASRPAPREGFSRSSYGPADFA
ncbi:MAG: hypothetical protein Q9214_005022 [Letrouitia sp. 1 TL-2023]